jgi:hypothetical protein
VFLRRKSVTKRVGVKYIHFEREPANVRGQLRVASARPSAQGQRSMADTGPKDLFGMVMTTLRRRPSTALCYPLPISFSPIPSPFHDPRPDPA